MILFHCLRIKHQSKTQSSPASFDDQGGAAAASYLRPLLFLRRWKSVAVSFARWLNGNRLQTALRVFTLLLLLPLKVFGQSVDSDAGSVTLEKKLYQHDPAVYDYFEEQVWLTYMSARMKRFVKNSEQRIVLLKKIYSEARRAKLRPELILAIIHTESGFDRYAVSSAGAQGLMQIMPFWKKVIGHPKDNLTLIDVNLRYGCAILSLYLKKEKGQLSRALARYNGSLGKYWYPERVYANLEEFWQ